MLNRVVYVAVFLHDTSAHPCMDTIIDYKSDDVTIHNLNTMQLVIFVVNITVSNTDYMNFLMLMN